MLAFPSMLVKPAQEAGIKVPDNPDNFDPNEYEYFHVFCCVQLGASMPSATSHWENAKLIASLSTEEIRTVTYDKLVERGLQIGHPQP